MTIKYRKPSGVEVKRRERPLLSTGAGGFVAVDETMLSLWKLAHGRTLDEILESFHARGATPETVRAGLACLAEGGLLERVGEKNRQRTSEETVGGRLVSAIVPITAEKELEWLGDCVLSLFAQTYSELEVIVVDNATSFGLAAWLEAAHPRARLLKLERRQSFAATLNQGVSKARGAYFLLLNPDVKLETQAVAQLVDQAKRDPKCGAVAAKLRFLWAPSFLNGLGNRVRDFGWGTDNAVGHLDLGQFDHWEEVPSACFAATLIPRTAWEDLGPMDEGFQLYYGDCEWSYRARLLGYSVRVAPRADILHVFGCWVKDSREPTGLTPWKLRDAAYGRLRFASKIVGSGSARRFLHNYFREDWSNIRLAIGRLDLGAATAYSRAWWAYVTRFFRIRRERRALQARRTCPDEVVFGSEASMPSPHTYNDLPLLSWDLVVRHYTPLIVSARTRPIPEWRKTVSPPV